MVVTCFSSYYEKILATGEIQCIDEDLPFAIPNTWEWVRLRNITSLLGDGIHGTPEYDNNGSYFFINGNNLKEKSIIIKSETKRVNETEYLKYKKELNENTVLVSINGTLGNVAFYNNEPIMLGKSACYFNLLSKQFKSYIYIVLNTPYFLEYALSAATGTTIKNVSLQAMNNLLVPFPSISEQCRIVEKLEQLETYFAKYNKKEKQLSLLNASIHQALKKSVLQEAIQGKLVPQDPNEEPASVLLQRIKEEKLRLVKEGKLRKKDVIDSTIFRGDDNKYFEKKSKETREITDEIPFDIPNSWQWCRVKQILDIGSARRVHQKDWRSTGIPFYRAREIGKLAEYGNVNNELFIDYELYKEFSTSGVPMPGDLMVTAVGTLGKVYVVKDGDLFYYKDGSVLCINNRYNLNPLYLKYVIGSPMFINQFVGESQGTTVATLTMVRFNDYLMPIPPLREQERIVKSIAAISRAGANSKTY